MYLVPTRRGFARHVVWKGKLSNLFESDRFSLSIDAKLLINM